MYINNGVPYTEASKQEPRSQESDYPDFSGVFDSLVLEGVRNEASGSCVDREISPIPPSGVLKAGSDYSPVTVQEERDEVLDEPVDDWSALDALLDNGNEINTENLKLFKRLIESQVRLYHETVIESVADIKDYVIRCSRGNCELGKKIFEISERMLGQIEDERALYTSKDLTEAEIDVAVGAYQDEVVAFAANASNVDNFVDAKMNVFMAIKTHLAPVNHFKDRLVDFATNFASSVRLYLDDTTHLSTRHKDDIRECSLRTGLERDTHQITA
jgi:hypothetical protein